MKDHRAEEGGWFRGRSGLSNHFITSIIQGLLPSGHCDISPTSPGKRWFARSICGVIDRMAVVLGLGDASFVFVPRKSCTNVVIHDPLAVAGMGRVGVEADLKSVVNYLLPNLPFSPRKLNPWTRLTSTPSHSLPTLKIGYQAQTTTTFT